MGFEKRGRLASVQLRNKEITQEKYNALQEAYERQSAEEFIKNLRTESISVDNEFRRRLSPSELKTIVSAGPILDPNITIHALGPPGTFGIFFIESLANELEELANKLSSDKRRWWVWPSVLIAITFLVLLVFLAIHSGFRITRICDPQSPPPE